MIRWLLIAGLILMTTDRKVIVPANGAKPVGPYSPGLLVGGYLYASGQGVRDAKGVVPEGITAQTRQCLENVKAIVEAAGLSMAHVVHMQLYFDKIGDFAEVDRVYATYFPEAPPARVVIAPSKMPTDTTVEMTAVAVKDLKSRKAVLLKSLRPLGHASAAIEAGGRLYLSAVYGTTASDAEQRLQEVLKESGFRNVAYRNDYGSSASAAIPMNGLPESAQAAVSAIALREPGNEGTIFCPVQTGSGATVQEQVSAAMTRIQQMLAQQGANLSHVVATNVYLDDINEFTPMNETYAKFFSGAPPTRTTVQPYPSSDRSKGTPVLVRISVVAVKD
jgi:reactive intermediate/imine deaminase